MSPIIKRLISPSARKRSTPQDCSYFYGFPARNFHKVKIYSRLVLNHSTFSMRRKAARFGAAAPQGGGAQGPLSQTKRLCSRDCIISLEKMQCLLHSLRICQHLQEDEEREIYKD